MWVLRRNESTAIDHEVLTRWSYRPCVISHLIRALDWLPNSRIEPALQNDVAVADPDPTIGRIRICLELLPANRLHIVWIENTMVRWFVVLALVRSACSRVTVRSRLESGHVHSSIDDCLISLLSLGRPRLVATAHVLCLDYFHVRVRLRCNACETTVVLLLPQISVWHDHFIFSCDCAVKSDSAWAYLPAIGSKQIFRSWLCLLKGRMRILLVSCGLLSSNRAPGPSLEVWCADGTWHSCFE